jgi:hypothetical protein
MYKTLISHAKSLLENIKATFRQFKNQYAYELKAITPCTITNKHRVEVKVTGKGQNLNFYAEEVASDNNFLLGFCSTDIRTIVYLATSDKYEAILAEEKVKKSLDLIRSKNIDGNKSIQLRDKKTGNIIIKTLKDFNDLDIIEKLTSHDAYKLGYLAGQEQSWLSSLRLKVIKKHDLTNHE